MIDRPKDDASSCPEGARTHSNSLPLTNRRFVWGTATYVTNPRFVLPSVSVDPKGQVLGARQEDARQVVAVPHTNLRFVRGKKGHARTCLVAP